MQPIKSSFLAKRVSTDPLEDEDLKMKRLFNFQSNQIKVPLKLFEVDIRSLE